MNLDPFGHNVTARHFLAIARKELAKSTNIKIRDIWQNSISQQEEKIKQAEIAEIKYWQSFRN